MARSEPGRMDEASLREGALAHMLRYGGTGASLTRALDKRVNPHRPFSILIRP